MSSLGEDFRNPAAVASAPRQSLAHTALSAWWGNALVNMLSEKTRVPRKNHAQDAGPLSFPELQETLSPPSASLTPESSPQEGPSLLSLSASGPDTPSQVQLSRPWLCLKPVVPKSSYEVEQRPQTPLLLL